MNNFFPADFILDSWTVLPHAKDVYPIFQSITLRPFLFLSFNFSVTVTLYSPLCLFSLLHYLVYLWMVWLHLCMACAISIRCKTKKNHYTPMHVTIINQCQYVGLIFPVLFEINFISIIMKLFISFLLFLFNCFTLNCSWKWWGLSCSLMIFKEVCKDIAT